MAAGECVSVSSRMLNSSAMNLPKSTPSVVSSGTLRGKLPNS